MMSKATAILALGVLLLALAAGVAAAQTVIQCTSVPCFGTDNNDRIFERKGNDLRDEIYAGRGNDVVDAQDYRSDEDRIFGQAGNDRIRTDDGDGQDFVNCGRGNNDVAIIDNGDRARNNCEDVRIV
jgi:hypothetical protein